MSLNSLFTPSSTGSKPGYNIHADNMNLYGKAVIKTIETESIQIPDIDLTKLITNGPNKRLTTNNSEEIEWVDDVQQPVTTQHIVSGGSNKQLTTNNSGTVQWEDIKNKRVIRVSARSYIRLNQWYGFQSTYGYQYYNWTTYYGNAEKPKFPEIDSKGILIEDNGLIRKIQYMINRTSTTEEDYEYSIDCMREGEQINILSFKNGDYSTNNVIESFEVEFGLKEKDIIMIAGRKITGSTSSRYPTVAFNIILE